MLQPYSLPPKILVVDDDKRLNALLIKFLSENHYEVNCVHTTEDARKAINNTKYDLMVLDVMMPGETGVMFTRSIRESDQVDVKTLPILMLTALGESEERIDGLSSGADDYLTKPFEPQELLLRIEKLIERCRPQSYSQSKQDILSFGSLSFHKTDCTLRTSQGEIINLTSAELNLFMILAETPRESISRDELAENLGVSLSPRTIDVQITRLRKKIEADPRQPRYLRTIRHKGYALWPD